MKAEPGKLVFGHYVVGLIDFLNQGNELERLNTLPDGETGRSEFIEAARKTVGLVRDMRASFATLFEEANKRRTPPGWDRLNDLGKQRYEEVTSVEIGQQTFSDTVVIYSPLLNSKKVLTLNGLHNMVFASGALQLLTLSEGIVFRGGIDVGVGVLIEEGELYGPVLRHAYHLENSVAKYPRVVVGSGALGYIEHLERTEGVVPGSNRALAAICRAMIHVDEDGHSMVDFLAEDFQRIGFPDDFSEIAKKALTFVERERDRFKDEKKPELADRYERLRRYFVGRLGHRGH